VPSSDTEPLSLTVPVKERGREQLASLRTEGSDVREMGCYFEHLWVGFEGGSGGKESADSLGERRRRFHKNLTQCNRNGGSRGRALGLTSLLSFNRGCDSLSVGGGGLGGHSGGGSPSGV